LSEVRKKRHKFYSSLQSGGKNKLLVQQQHNPIHARGIRRRPRVAGSDGEGSKIAAANGSIRAAGQRFGMQAGIRQNCGAACQGAHGAGPKLVGLRHGARGIVIRKLILPLQVRLARVPARIDHSGCDVLFHFVGRVAGEGVAEIFDDIKPFSAPHDSHPDYVVIRIEQVRPVRRRKHQMFVAMLGIVVVGNILSLLIELEFGRVRQTLWQRRLAVKLMRKLLRLDHRLGVNAGGLRESGIQREGLRSHFLARLIRHRKEGLLRLRVCFSEWDVGRGRSSLFQAGFLSVLTRCYLAIRAIA